jgi:hypothetical protein
MNRTHHDFTLPTSSSLRHSPCPIRHRRPGRLEPLDSSRAPRLRAASTFRPTGVTSCDESQRPGGGSRYSNLWITRVEDEPVVATHLDWWLVARVNSRHCGIADCATVPGSHRRCARPVRAEMVQPLPRCAILRQHCQWTERPPRVLRSRALQTCRRTAWPGTVNPVPVSRDTAPDSGTLTGPH